MSRPAGEQAALPAHDRPGAPPAYEIAVRNSFAVYLATWLLDAMAVYWGGAS